jgi:molybdate transport system regulatory protein
MSTKARQSPPRSSATATTVQRAESPPMSSPGIRFRVDFHDRCSVGIGKISLLEAIARTGSLSQAARDIGMSYRRAWLLIDSMNSDFDVAVIRATVGGSGGGGAQLTSFGRELIQAYRKLEDRLASLTLEHMSGIAAHVAGPHRRAPASGAPLRGRLSRPLKQTAVGRRGVRS